MDNLSDLDVTYVTERFVGINFIVSVVDFCRLFFGLNHSGRCKF